jgi:hypothetical protein
MTQDKVAQFLVKGLIFGPLAAMALASGGSATPGAPSAQSAPQRPRATPANSTASEPVVAVTPSTWKITTAQALTVTAVVSGGSGEPTPTGSVRLTGGRFSSPVRTLVNGKFVFHIGAGRLGADKDTLTATYTPDPVSASKYKSASGHATVTVTKDAPGVIAKLSAAAITTQQPLTVSISVDAGIGAIPPTGSVAVTSGAYASSATAVANGKATIEISAGSLQPGGDTLTIIYTPNAGSAALYEPASTSKTVTVTKITPVVAVTLSSSTITTLEALAVMVSVGAGPGDMTPTGAVNVAGGS